MKWVIFVILVSLCWSSSSQSPSFDDYCLIFNKQYNDSTEKALREEYYNAELIEIDRVNADSSIDYAVAVNNLTDWSPSELATLRTVISVNPTHSNNPNNSNNTIKSAKVGVAGDSLNWVNFNYVTSVKDQGGCGACWAFATTAAVQSHIIMKKQVSNTLDLSEQYLLTCTTGSTCAGGYLDVTMQNAQNNGLPTEELYPYNPYLLNKSICTTKGTPTSAASTNSYFGLGDQEIINELINGPVAITIYASNSWNSYTTGILSCSAGTRVNHAVLLVGYTPTYWIIKNQWGSSWGKSGYIWVTRSRTNSYTNCFIGDQISTFDGSANPNYQTKMLFTCIFLLVLVFIN